MTEEQIWSRAVKIATAAEPKDPHARYELIQAIVDLVKNAAPSPVMDRER